MKKIDGLTQIIRRPDGIGKQKWSSYRVMLACLWCLKDLEWISVRDLTYRLEEQFFLRTVTPISVGQLVKRLETYGLVEREGFGNNETQVRLVHFI